MLKFVLMSLTGILITVMLGCGGPAPPDETVTTAPVTKAEPQAAAVQLPSGGTLEQAAARLAGGPGAIYVGDLSQLVGPAPLPELGFGPEGVVPLNLLEGEKWIYTSDYYQSLLERANFDSPTPLVTQGEAIQIQYACVNRAVYPCKVKEKFFAANVLERTGGQLEIQVVAYPELGIAGPDSLTLLSNGALSFAEIAGAYVGGELPVLDMYYFWGLFDDRETDFRALTSVLEDLDQYIEDASGCGVVVGHNWYGGNDQWFFSRKRLDTLEDYEGLKIRSHGTTISDLINGLGADAQFVAFVEVYTALERGILDAGVTGGSAGFSQRWYEVADYIAGPVTSMPADLLIINPEVWNSLPADFQQIMLEEAAKSELEELRMVPVWNATALQKNIEAGMEHIPWNDEMHNYIRNEIVLGRMLPNWVNRVGGYGTDEVRLFNEKFGPIAGVKIQPDGTASLINATGGGKAQR